MRNTLLLTGVGLFAMACASAPAPQPVPAAAAVPAITPAALEADAFRRELEEAHTAILARSNGAIATTAPTVDVEAAASISIPEHRTIDSAVRLFSGRMKESIQASLIRSGRYRKLIDKTLEEERLPKALAYLPVIESAYLPTLTSRAGAYGIWQFMPATAREYGLRVDWWIDERADPEKSTRAAAAYLKDLHRMFDDWSLALAAYNCGPGRVRRTLDQSGASSFWELLDEGLLPKETRGYVPTFFATILIASDPAAYDMRLGDVVDTNERTIEVRGPLSLDYVAEVAGVDRDLLEELNPALRRGVVPPGRGEIRVPSHVAERLVARADRLHQEDDYVKFATYRVRKGDTVARLARTLGTKQQTLLEMNGLRKNERLEAGDSIYVPARAREVSALIASAKNVDTYYAVKKGDTLYAIAKRNGLTVAELRELNDLRKNTTLHPGQKLRVAAPRTVTAGGM